MKMTMSNCPMLITSTFQTENRIDKRKLEFGLNLERLSIMGDTGILYKKGIKQNSLNKDLTLKLRYETNIKI